MIFKIMKSRKVLMSSIFFMFASILFATPFDFAKADAWWGYGARKPEWVLSHGGTIIYFEFENISGKSSKYKAIMYDSNGKFVEKEFGKKGLFDDAKNGVYKISAFKGGKAFTSISVTAKPGKAIKVNLQQGQQNLSGWTPRGLHCLILKYKQAQ